MDSNGKTPARVRSNAMSVSTLEPATTREPRGSIRRKGTLLIVDDEEGPRQSLEIIFKNEYAIFCASDGPSAIKLALEHRIDVAVLDVRMAGMSGIEVLERLKFVDPSIEVVMMTAYETTETMRKALRLRACDYINKPFDLASMRSAVASAMQRRTLESEISTNNEKLHELLVELENHKIEKQMQQTRSDIYASIIHDINGPLTVLSGFMQLINQRIGDADQLSAEDIQFVKDRLKTMTRQVTTCIEISRRYLGFLRKQSSASSQARVNQLLADMEHLLRVHPSRLENDLEIAPLTEDAAVKMNGTDLIQILLNLTVNAFQCTTQPHKVTISGELLKEPLDLATLTDTTRTRLFNIEGFHNVAPLVKLSVIDDGPGIPQEVLPKIFQPYFTTKGPKQGTGLGLNIVQRLIQENAGALHVSTNQGKGTTFTTFVAAVPSEP